MRKTITYGILSVLVLATFASSLVLNSAKADDSLTDPPPQFSASAFCNVSVLPGWTWYFFGFASGGVGNCAYQWYEGTTLLVGQTSMLLTITKDVPGAYNYYLVATDDAGSIVKSNVVTLTVLDPYA
jgi:hypothetical protein